MSELSSVCQIYSTWAKGTVLYTRWAARCGIGYPELMVLYSLKTETGLTQRQIKKEGLLFSIPAGMTDVKNWCC